MTPEEFKSAQTTAKPHTGFVLGFYSTKDTETTEVFTELWTELVAEYTTCQFIKIDIDDESNAAFIAAFSVTQAPTVITFMDKTGAIEHIQGVEAPVIFTAVEQLASKSTLYQRLNGLINQSKFVLFMKGTKDAPRCGFSRKMVALLNDNGVTEFETFDILNDQDVRDAIKIYSKWPTFPQLYCDGELLGGLDVVTEMVEAGELKELLE